MISKCQNVVINRTKFSDFDEFNTETDLIDNLNLVGYVEELDPLGNVVSKNVSVKYPADFGPRIDNIENIIGIQAFENIDSSTCEHKVDCCIACKIAEIEENIEAGFKRDAELSEYVETEIAGIKEELNTAKAEIFSPQENIIFVHTSLENGSVELSVADIMDRYDNASNSSIWSLVIVTAIKAGDKMIYPDITYSGEVDKGNYDKRKITIEHGTETKDITVVINAIKHTSKAIISL